MAIQIVQSRDAFLFALTPLKPILYFKRGFASYAIPLVSAFVLLPVLLILALFGSRELEGLVTHWPFAMSLVLTWLLMFLVPLYEALSGRCWTRVFFPFPRIVWFVSRRILPEPQGCLVQGILLAAVFVARERVLQDLLSLKAWLVASGLIGKVTYYLLLPLGGLWELHSPVMPDHVQWTIVIALGLFFLALVQSICGYIRLPLRDLERLHLEEWLQHRQVVEEDEEARFESFRKVSQPASHLVTDGLAEGESFDPDLLRAPDSPLPYDPALDPEKQLVRHVRFWKEALLLLASSMSLKALQRIDRLIARHGWLFCMS
ncbi:hypothetical protein FJY63_11555, partial [Candidatus Sumerlaeota bacterium]|nr:hypothetical protein [Candidatus Sumerlaeota bacterium]